MPDWWPDLPAVGAALVDAWRRTWDFLFVERLAVDGFVAVVALSVVAPVLGTWLVLRRMPMLALAVPQLAGLGQAFAYFAFAATLTTFDALHPEEPSKAHQLVAASVCVVLGLGSLTVFCRRHLGVGAAIAYLLALGLREILFLKSPYHEIFEDALHHGRILIVGPEGRVTVLWASGALLVLAALTSRWTLRAGFDPDLARLMGSRPRLALFWTLLLLGALSVLTVPVVGPEVVLCLLLVPPAIVRGAAPSLASLAPLAVLASVLGTGASFVLAVGLDWSAGPSLVVSVVLASLLVAAATGLVRLVLRR